jgi:hypothetical protein
VVAIHIRVKHAIRIYSLKHTLAGKTVSDRTGMLGSNGRRRYRMWVWRIYQVNQVRTQVSVSLIL